MTYNIHRWAGADRRFDVARLAAVIRTTRADIITLNEVLNPVVQGRRTHDLLAELAGRLGMFYAFGPSGWIDQGPGWRGPQGNAILSRYRLSGVTNVNLPRLWGSKQRALLSAVVHVSPGRQLRAFVTHLDHAFEWTRWWQLRGVLRQIAHRDPHFLAGDFNAPGFRGPQTRRLLPPVLRAMADAGYFDAFDRVGFGSGHTFPARTPLVRLDFLFFPQRWAHGLRDAQTISLPEVVSASDHRPVMAEWTWPDHAQTAEYAGF